MSTIHLQLPDSLNVYLSQEAARRRYANPSDFIQNLIEADRHRQLKDDIESMLMESINGQFSDWGDKDLDDIRQAGQRIINRRKAR